MVTFQNGEMKRFDMKPYLNIGIFNELKDPEVFYTVKPILGSIEWSDGADLCPDTLYLDGENCLRGSIGNSGTYFAVINN